jgi:hypothetical protein
LTETPQNILKVVNNGVIYPFCSVIKVSISLWMERIFLRQWWYLIELKENFEFLSLKFSHWTRYFCLINLSSAWASLTYSFTNINSVLWISKSRGFCYTRHWASFMAFLAIKTLFGILAKNFLLNSFKTTLTYFNFLHKMTIKY